MASRLQNRPTMLENLHGAQLARVHGGDGLGSGIIPLIKKDPRVATAADKLDCIEKAGKDLSTGLAGESMYHQLMAGYSQRSRKLITDDVVQRTTDYFAGAHKCLGDTP
jgi:hypothetical protein